MMSILTVPLPAVSPTLGPAPTPQLVINGELTMPAITTLEQFLEWRMSDACPERGRFAFFGNTLWVDLMSEQAYTHNRVKVAFTMTLERLSLEQDTGTYFADGMDLLNHAAGFATVPDGMYVLYDSFRSGRVVRQPNRHQVGVVRLEGTPDMVLEVVSDSSEDKDYVTFEAKYHVAGIPEFWRVDARGELRFEILRREASGYVPTQQPDGWWRSEVFGRDFLLTAEIDPIGEPRFRLQHRP
jgi:Uma2 family endonuclease